MRFAPAGCPGGSLLGSSCLIIPCRRAAGDIEEAFRVARGEHVEAVLVLRVQVGCLAIRDRLPVMWYNREAVEAGVLTAYGVNVTDLFRRAAGYVDKILKGAKPAELPVEQPTKFELVINLKTAKALGLTIPPSLLLRADQVLE